MRGKLAAKEGPGGMAERTGEQGCDPFLSD